MHSDAFNYSTVILQTERQTAGVLCITKRRKKNRTDNFRCSKKREKHSQMIAKLLRAFNNEIASPGETVL